MTGYRPYCPYTVNPDGSGVWKAPNVALARQLVRESGTGGDRVVVAQPPTDYKQEPSSRYLVRVLDELGYRAALGPPFRNFVDYATAVFKGRTQIGPLGWSSTPDGGQQVVLWTCQFAPYDAGRYCNPRIDKLYNRGVRLQATDPQAAPRMWAAVDKALVDNAAALPIWTESGYALVHDRVGNWSSNFAWGILLSQLWVR